MSKRKTVLPSHMKKTIERVEELASAVDLVLEVVDARAPLASQCHILKKILVGSKHVKIISKADLANPKVTREWKRFYDQQAIPWTELPFNRKVSAAEFLKHIGVAEARAAGAMLKMLVIGIPNVGKSTLINALVGRRSAPVGAKPGVTRGLQLVKVHEGVFIYDTPGVINPTIKSEAHAYILGLIGCLQEHFFDAEGAAYFLAERIVAEGRTATFEESYGIASIPRADVNGLLDALARRRGFLLPGGVTDVPRACKVLAADFATGRLKGISLESPDPMPLKM